MKTPAVYMLASNRNGTLYLRVTSNLIRRIWQHREEIMKGFTREHGVHRLVWYETHPTMHSAITREKQLKKWHRSWKIRLIEEKNPGWRDLYPETAGGEIESARPTGSVPSGFPPSRE